MSSAAVTSPDFGPSTRFSRAAAIRQRELGDEIILYNPRTDAVSSLGGVGALVWELLDEPSSADDMAQPLADSFGITAVEAVTDLMQLFEELHGSGLIEQADPPGP